MAQYIIYHVLQNFVQGDSDVDAIANSLRSLSVAVPKMFENISSQNHSKESYFHL